MELLVHIIFHEIDLCHDHSRKCLKRVGKGKETECQNIIIYRRQTVRFIHRGKYSDCQIFQFVRDDET